MSIGIKDATQRSATVKKSATCWLYSKTRVLGGFAAAHGGKPLAFRRATLNYHEATPPAEAKPRKIRGVTESQRLSAVCGGTAAGSSFRPASQKILIDSGAVQF